jgi:2-amino-4-hydroxy-6-hydroxymethyldihydropteridine diphosphokinase
MERAYISIGSNIDAARHIRAAVVRLRKEFGHVHLSPVYESQAIGFAGDNFYNLVAGVDTHKSPQEVNRILHRIEQENGRERSAHKFAPRTLDLDLLLYGDLCMQERGLNLPREEISAYAFVLRPLADIAPHEYHPLTGLRFVDMWANFDKSAQVLWQVKLAL